MKDLIVIVGSILLGCIIFNLIAGDEISLKAASGEKMTEILQLYKE